MEEGVTGGRGRGAESTGSLPRTAGPGEEGGGGEHGGGAT